MTPAELAALQARAYRDMAPWSERDFADLLDQPATLCITRANAFCLGRTILDEAEILALATDPGRQRQGLASALLSDFIRQAAERGAERIFLEVAATNAPALAFYAARGFAPAGRRRAYYRQPDGTHTDALLMSRALTRG